MPSTQFAFRTSKTVGLQNAAPTYESVEGYQTPEGACRICAYSPNGKYVGLALEDNVRVVSSENGAVTRQIDVRNVFEIGFSPLGSFIVTWQRPSKTEDGNAEKNLKVWSLGSGEMIGSFVQKSQSGWNLQYTQDEKLCARLVTNEVQFFDPENFVKGPVHRLRVEGVTDFSLSPGKNNAVAVFVPEKKSAPAVVRVFNIPGFGAPVSQKNFFKADKIQMKWNQLGTGLLVLTQTDVDKTNKSYYGETNLYLLNLAGNFDSRITLDREGPIHDVTWSPNSKEFGVVYGFMPAKTTIFDYRANALHSLPLGPRNTIIFSPHGNLVISAGFGNLSGMVEILEREGMRKVHTLEASNTTVCEWSPDSRYFLTATTSPRLRVDNGIRIWHCSGKLMYKQDMTELYQVFWRPESPENFPWDRNALLAPAPHLSAASYVPKPMRQAGGAYRPPGARGMPARQHEPVSIYETNGDEDSSSLQSQPRTRVVPGAPQPSADRPMSKTAIKNKKKRENKEGTETHDSASTAAPPNAGAVNGNNPESNTSEVDKRVRGLMKKLRAIEDLKARQASGDKLEMTQVKKIEAGPQIKNDLKSLGWNGNI